jgi:Domain of unknown function (DUF4352)
MVASIIAIAIVLVGCGAEKSKDDEKADEPTASEEKKDNEKETTKDEEKPVSNEDDNVIEDETGKFTIEKVKELNKVVENGPIKLTITDIQSTTAEPSDEYKDMFDDKEKVTLIMIGMKVENTSEETVSFYPNQATLTTNTGEQVDADLYSSDDVGGDFFGKIKKEGKVVFQLDSPAKEISEINLIISGATNENVDSLGEDIQLPLSF